MDVTTPCHGTVLEILVDVDETLSVGATLAQLEVTEEEMQRVGLSKSADTSLIRPAAKPGGACVSLPAGIPTADNVHFRIDESEFIATDHKPKVKPTLEGLPVPARATGAAYLSPRMKVRMEELGLHAADLSGIHGSGAGGRVTIEDLEKFLDDIEHHKTTAASPMRIAVADSMRRSWTRPLATVGISVALDRVLNHRKNQDPKPRSPSMPSGLWRLPWPKTPPWRGGSWASGSSTPMPLISASRWRPPMACWFRFFARWKRSPSRC